MVVQDFKRCKGLAPKLVCTVSTIVPLPNLRLCREPRAGRFSYSAYESFPHGTHENSFLNRVHFGLDVCPVA